MTPNPTTTAPTTEEWMRLAIEELHAYFEHVRSDSLAVPDSDHSESILARHYADAHPSGAEISYGILRTAVNLACNCGGNIENHPDACPACDVWHRVQRMLKEKSASAECMPLYANEAIAYWKAQWNTQKAERDQLTTALAEAKSRCAELEKTNKELQEVCDLVGSQLEASAQDCIDETQHREQIEKNCLQAFDLSQQWQKDCELAKARAETAEAQCDRMKAALEECQRILEDEAPELNITNYDDSQAYDLNEAANKVYGVIRAALSTPPAEEKPS